MKRWLLLWLLVTAFRAQAGDWQESPEVAALFTSAGVVGTFVLYDVAADRYVGHDRSRAQTRFIPASTFKIPHSLIGLAVGAVAHVDEIVPYTGLAQPFIESWGRDMGLRDAIALSNVPIYQELARRIGLERMGEHVRRLEYGNMAIGDQVDRFWLKGPLKISAVEQVLFLGKLAKGGLPYAATQQQSLRDILLLEQGPGWKLYGKTGWQNAPEPGVGWWVGWVEKGEQVYSFALNMDIRRESDAAKRMELGRASLVVLKVLE
ncbi:class D beta-lactamase [Trichloromonas acetexigens]|uniref:Beta-lactamase n=1 Tax=Trichloromonas acetexigens TaxID=38815 RepID=A0A550JH18_9BACT|nr:class D beta-lactamase [Desulfuromonas acetexigens]TRO82510.1 class D beta-lactamase [Desulfuromonas acetexigens]